MWVQRIGQFSIVLPAILMMVGGFFMAVRSVDVRLNSAQGVRQVASNATHAVATVGLLVAVLYSVQKLVGFNLGLH